jgi:hypothetical protein
MAGFLLELCVPALGTCLSSLDICFAWQLPSLDWGMHSAVGGMREFFHPNLQEEPAPPRTLFRQTDETRRLDMVFSQGHIFPSLKVINMTLAPQVGQQAKTLKGYKERWSKYRWRLEKEVNAAFAHTRKSSRPVFNVTIPKKLFVV